MLNYTTSSWFPLYKFRVGEGLCDKDYMLGATKFNNTRDYITGEKIKQFSTVIWSRKFNVNILLNNYLEHKNDNKVHEKLEGVNLTCDLKI